TRYWRDWSSDVCSSDLPAVGPDGPPHWPPRTIKAVGSEIAEVVEQARVGRLPAEGPAGVGTRRGLVQREDGPERAERLGGHLLDRHTQAPADDARNVTDGVAFVGDGVP